MMVFLVRWDDGDDRVVEGEDFGSAIKTWRDDLIEKWKRDGDYDEGDEDGLWPSEVKLLSEEPVVRAP